MRLRQRRLQLRYLLALRIERQARIPGHWSGGEGWGQVLLTHGGLVSTQNAPHFPETMDLVLGWGVPIYSAWFSVLEPGRHLKTHEGEYKGILRYHLGLDIPPMQRAQQHSAANGTAVSPAEVDQHWRVAGDRTRAYGGRKCWSSPAHLVVFSYSRDKGTGQRPRAPDGGRPRIFADEANCLAWKPGADIVFDDAFYHYAVNTSPNQRRVVLFVDFLRTDVPPWLALLNRFLLYYFMPTLQSLLFAATETSDLLGRVPNPLPGSPPWFVHGRFLAAHIVGVVVCLLTPWPAVAARARRGAAAARSAQQRSTRNANF